MSHPRMSGGQIVACVAMLAAAVVLAPVGVLAAGSATRVTITDPTYASHLARVSSTGALKTTTTVTGGKLAVSGSVNAHVTNSTLPASVRRAGTPFVTTLSPADCATACGETSMYQVPAAKTLILKTVSAADVTTPHAGQLHEFLTLSNPGVARHSIALPLHFTETVGSYDKYNAVETGLDTAVPSGWSVAAGCAGPSYCEVGYVTLTGYLVNG